MRSLKYSAAMIAAFLVATVPSLSAQEDWHKLVEAQRRQRDGYLRSDPFSPLALVHREYLDGRSVLTVGSRPDSDLRLLGKSVAAQHAKLLVISGEVTVYAGGQVAMVRSLGNGKSVDAAKGTGSLQLASGTGLRVGQYNLLCRAEAPVRGAAIEVYDTLSPALAEFRGLEYFPIDARYRVQAEIVPRAEPPQVHLVDSAGQPRPYYIYGDLRFTLDGPAVTMEVYSTTLDAAAIARDGFMLIFADATNGGESYYAGRYLDIAGARRGDGGLQPGAQPALRLQPSVHLPVPARAEPPGGGHPRRRESVQGKDGGPAAIACIHDHLPDWSGILS